MQPTSSLGALLVLLVALISVCHTSPVPATLPSPEFFLTPAPMPTNIVFETPAEPEENDDTVYGLPEDLVAELKLTKLQKMRMARRARRSMPAMTLPDPSELGAHTFYAGEGTDYETMSEALDEARQRNGAHVIVIAEFVNQTTNSLPFNLTHGVDETIMISFSNSSNSEFDCSAHDLTTRPLIIGAQAGAVFIEGMTLDSCQQGVFNGSIADVSEYTGLILTDCHFANSVGDHGGIIHAQPNTMTVLHKVHTNMATANKGSVYYAGGSASTMVVDCHFDQSIIQTDFDEEKASQSSMEWYYGMKTQHTGTFHLANEDNNMFVAYSHFQETEQPLGPWNYDFFNGAATSEIFPYATYTGHRPIYAEGGVVFFHGNAFTTGTSSFSCGGCYNENVTTLPYWSMDTFMRVNAYNDKYGWIDISWTANYTLPTANFAQLVPGCQCHQG